MRGSAGWRECLEEAHVGAEAQILGAERAALRPAALAHNGTVTHDRRLRRGCRCSLRTLPHLLGPGFCRDDLDLRTQRTHRYASMQQEGQAVGGMYSGNGNRAAALACLRYSSPTSSASIWSRPGSRVNLQCVCETGGGGGPYLKIFFRA